MSQSVSQPSLRPLRSPLVIVAFLSVFLMTGCIPTRIGVGWPGVMTIGERQNILLVYNELITLVDPQSGQEVQLLNEEGQPRIDPETNQVRRWVLNTVQGAQFYAEPLLMDENTLLVADYNRRLFDVDLTNARIENLTGTTISGQVVASLTSDGENLYLPYYNRNLQAVDLETLEPVWTMETDNGIWAKPLLHEDTLYFGSMNHLLYAVDAATGEELWQLDLEGSVSGTPVLYEDRLYVGSFARKVFEISLDGEILNTYETENWVWSSPSIVDGVLYTADMAGFVYALDIEAGLTPLWKTKATSRGIRPTPLVTEQVVVVAGRDGQIDWLDRGSGEILIRQDVQSEILSDILLIQPSEALDITQPLVIISTTNRSQLLVAFTLNEGAKSWVYSR